MDNIKNNIESKIDILKDNLDNIYTDEYDKSIHYILFSPILCFLQYKNVIRLLKNKFVDDLMLINNSNQILNDRIFMIENLVNLYIDNRISEGKKYNVFKPKLLNQIMSILKNKVEYKDKNMGLTDEEKYIIFIKDE